MSDNSIPSGFDVLVVGAGAAGMYAALCLSDRLKVGLISKDNLKTGASDWAQGGIAAAIDRSDSPQLHLKDTIAAGAGLCDLEAVKFLVENAPSSIKSLLELGVAFDRHGDDLAMTLEAAHSRPRVLHAADTTGRAIIDSLSQKVLEKPNITILSQAFALSLWLDSQTLTCKGVSILYENKILWLKASSVILATGGLGQVFSLTTNPKQSTGDGIALAWRAGAILRDLEFIQFHPTALTKTGAPHFLISEATRGEGAHLIDKQGHRFAIAYHPSGELAPRDVVSRAIFSHLEKTKDANVFLDLKPIGSDRIRKRFPNIIQVCQRWGIDVFTEPIPVAPAAHYSMGGIATDLFNRTSISRLYAVGETASTGVHGANRLASNSLLECIVFAAQFSDLDIQPKSFEWCSSVSVVELLDIDEEMDKITTIREKLPILMWHNAGICRNRQSLETALAQVKSWREEVSAMKITRYLLSSSGSGAIEFKGATSLQLRFAAETINLLDVGYLILKSAKQRSESRGGHYRVDYPKEEANWQAHTLIQGESILKAEVKM